MYYNLRPKVDLAITGCRRITIIINDDPNFGADIEPTLAEPIVSVFQC